MSDENSTTHGFDDLSVALPKTATKPIIAPKKRGRKGDKIRKAFKEIPATAVDFDEYCATHGIKTTVMRQIKRHDHLKDTGKVFVRKCREGENKGKMMIWRDPSLKT